MTENEIQAMEESEKQRKVEVAALGEDAREFLGSPVGVYLWNKAQTEIDEATEALIFLPSDSPGELMDARIKARVGLKFRIWIAEAIESGVISENQLRQQEMDEMV